MKKRIALFSVSIILNKGLDLPLSRNKWIDFIKNLLQRHVIFQFITIVFNKQNYPTGMIRPLFCNVCPTSKMMPVEVDTKCL